MESFYSLCRCQYQRTSTFLTNLIDMLFQNYRVTNLPPTYPQLIFFHQKLIDQDFNSNEFLIVQGQLAILVSISTFILAGRIVSRAEDYDLLDGNLAARIFELLRNHERFLSQVLVGGISKQVNVKFQTPATSCKALLDNSLLDFLQQFRYVKKFRKVLGKF